MHHDFLDRYSRMDSPVHRVPAAVKLLVAVGLVIATVTIPAKVHGHFLGVVLLLLAVAGLSRVPPAFLLRRLLLLEPVVLMVALLSLFQPGGGNVFLAIVMKSTICLVTMILLSSTTPFAALLQVLRRLGVPGLLVTVLALMYRYLFVLVDEAERMSRARASRSFRQGRVEVWKSWATLLGQLFVRSTERAERIYAAMCARGWR